MFRQQASEPTFGTADFSPQLLVVEQQAHDRIEARHRIDRQQHEAAAAVNGLKLLPDIGTGMAKAFRSNTHIIEKIEQFTILDDYRPLIG